MRIPPRSHMRSVYSGWYTEPQLQSVLPLALSDGDLKFCPYHRAESQTQATRAKVGFSYLLPNLAHIFFLESSRDKRKVSLGWRKAEQG